MEGYAKRNDISPDGDGDGGTSPPADGNTSSTSTEDEPVPTYSRSSEDNLTARLLEVLCGPLSDGSRASLSVAAERLLRLFPSAPIAGGGASFHRLLPSAGAALLARLASTHAPQSGDARVSSTTPALLAARGVSQDPAMRSLRIPSPGRTGGRATLVGLDFVGTDLCLALAECGAAGGSPAVEDVLRACEGLMEMFRLAPKDVADARLKPTPGQPPIEAQNGHNDSVDVTPTRENGSQEEGSGTQPSALEITSEEIDSSKPSELSTLSATIPGMNEPQQNLMQLLSSNRDAVVSSLRSIRPAVAAASSLHVRYTSYLSDPVLFPPSPAHHNKGRPTQPDDESHGRVIWALQSLIDVRRRAATTPVGVPGPSAKRDTAMDLEQRHLQLAGCVAAMAACRDDAAATANVLSSGKTTALASKSGAPAPSRSGEDSRAQVTEKDAAAALLMVGSSFPRRRAGTGSGRFPDSHATVDAGVSPSPETADLSAVMSLSPSPSPLPLPLPSPSPSSSLEKKIVRLCSRYGFRIQGQLRVEAMNAISIVKLLLEDKVLRANRTPIVGDVGRGPPSGGPGPGTVERGLLAAKKSAAKETTVLGEAPVALALSGPLGCFLGADSVSNIVRLEELYGEAVREAAGRPRDPLLGPPGFATVDERLVRRDVTVRLLFGIPYGAAAATLAPKPRGAATRLPRTNIMTVRQQSTPPRAPPIAPLMPSTPRCTRKDSSFVPSTPVAHPSDYAQWIGRYRSIVPKPSNTLVLFFFAVDEGAFLNTLTDIDRCLIRLVCATRSATRAVDAASRPSPPQSQSQSQPLPRTVPYRPPSMPSLPPLPVPRNNLVGVPRPSPVLVHLSKNGELKDTAHSPNLSLPCNLKGVLFLYYSSLENILEAETKRLGYSKHPGLIRDVMFHRSLLALCAEVNLKSRSFLSPAFPNIMKIHEITPASFLKNIEIFVRINPELPTVLRRHLKDIEELIVDEHLWAKGGSFIPSLNRSRMAPASDGIWPPPVLVQDTAMDVRLELPVPASLLLPGPPGADTSRHAVAYIFRKMISVTSKRVQTLCVALKLGDVHMDHIWSTWKHFLAEHVQLLTGRHVDSFLICTIYAICKIVEVKPEVTFKKIIDEYRQKYIANSVQYQSRIKEIDLSEGLNGDVIKLYNEHYVPVMYDYIVRFQNLSGQREAMANVSSVTDAENLVNSRLEGVVISSEAARNSSGNVPSEVISYSPPATSSLPKISTGSSFNIVGSNFYISNSSWSTLISKRYNMCPKTRAIYSFGELQAKELALVNKNLLKAAKYENSTKSKSKSKSKSKRSLTSMSSISQKRSKKKIKKDV